MTNWTSNRTDDLERENATRRCANGQWLGCLTLILAFWAAMLLGFIIAWVLACP
jgi:hypothetical protein